MIPVPILPPLFRLLSPPTTSLQSPLSFPSPLYSLLSLSRLTLSSSTPPLPLLPQVAQAEKRVSEARLQKALSASDARLREQVYAAEAAKKELNAFLELSVSGYYTVYSIISVSSLPPVYILSDSIPLAVLFLSPLPLSLSLSFPNLLHSFPSSLSLSFPHLLHRRLRK